MYLVTFSKGSKRRDNISLETCTVSLPPTLGAMLATFGQLTKFRVAFGGSRGTVTLIYGDKRRKRTRWKKPSAPGAAKGEPKPAAKQPAVVPSFVPPPAQPGASREVQGVLILLTARQNCSQITSNLDLSKQILFWVFF